MNKKVIVISAIILVGLLFFVVYLFVLGGDKEVNEDENIVENVKEAVLSEPKTDSFVAERAEEYWEHAIFDDFGARYELMCDEVQESVTKEVFVQKYKEDRDERPLAKPESVDVGDVRIEDNKAFARITVSNLVYPDGTSSTTEFTYENGRWCRIPSNDTLEWLQK